MAAEPIILNPIGWGQFRLLGGLKRTLGLAGAYAGAAFIILLLLYRAMRADVLLPRFASGALFFFILIQTAILVFIGTNAIKRAIQRDFTTDMISSHRLSAMSGYTATLGYLTGPTCQCVALSFVNWIICTILSGIAGLTGGFSDLVGPTLMFVVMGCMATFAWSFQALMALCTRGRISVVGVFVILGFLSNLETVWTLPGLALVIPSYLVRTLTSLQSPTRATPQDIPVLTSMFSQLALSFTFFLAAARKYTRDDVAAFAGPLGYCLVALCALLAGVGFARVPQSPAFFAPRIFFNGNVQIVATFVALAMISVVPVANATRASAEWVRRKAKDPLFDTRRPRSFVESVLVTVLLALGILFLVLGKEWRPLFAEHDDMIQREQVAYCVAAFILTLLTIGGFLRVAYAGGTKIGWLLVLYVVAAWCLPMFADFSLDALTNPAAITEAGRSMLFTSSPVGLWVACCTEMEAPVVPGLLVQAGIAFVALALASRTRRR